MTDMIGRQVHQVVFGYSWIAKVTGVWKYGYVVEIDERHKEQFEKWGADMVQYTFFSGVYR